MQITKSKLTFILSGLLSLGLGMNAQAQEAAKTMSAPNDAVTKRLAPSANLEDAKVKDITQLNPNMDFGKVFQERIIKTPANKPSESEMGTIIASFVMKAAQPGYKFFDNLNDKSLFDFIKFDSKSENSNAANIADKRILDTEGEKQLDALIAIFQIDQDNPKMKSTTKMDPDKASNYLIQSVITQIIKSNSKILEK